jgi:4-amino-4-deoxy-L-arabinose transferase-like glycosyltransferase
MNKEEKIVQEKKEALKRWFSDPYRIGIILIILFSLIIRIIYFVKTSQQTLWWDEAEYMSTAKSWAFDIPFELNPQRPPLFQFLGSLLLMIGLSDRVLQFLLVVVPSVLFVYVTYWTGKEIFDKKIGLIAAFGVSIMWSFLFWTTRFQPDFWSISFQVLALGIYWKGMKNKSNKLAIYAGFFAALGFYFKITSLLVPIIIFIFVFINEGFSFVKFITILLPTDGCILIMSSVDLIE